VFRVTVAGYIVAIGCVHKLAPSATGRGGGHKVLRRPHRAIQNVLYDAMNAWSVAKCQANSTTATSKSKVNVCTMWKLVCTKKLNLISVLLLT